mmetsp:Transcript_25827/g.44106  ORF Transcript_25827/g.44106 Transcript_25827/m.44106 type:complete len:101 (+) Transcript_25827:444-746(+)
MALVFVGWISEYLIENPDTHAIIVDGEWVIGNLKMDVLIICTMDYKVYVFHLAEICRGDTQFPPELADFLSDPVGATMLFTREEYRIATLCLMATDQIER